MGWFTDTRIKILLVLLQLSLCLPFINSFSIDLDEPFSVFWAQQDLTIAFDFFSNGNNPPLHNILLHFWVKMFGISPIAVRSLSLLFSLLTIPVLFNFAKKLLGSPYATLVCLMFIFSSFNHYHALEARNYSLMVLLAVLIFRDLNYFLFDGEKVFWQLALWNGLMLYTHYLGFFILGCELILFVLLMKHVTWKKVAFLSLSFFITALIFLPSLVIFFERLSDFSQGGTWVPDPHPTEIYGNIVRFLNGRNAVVLFAGLTLTAIAMQFINIKSDLAFIVPYMGMYVFSVYVQPVFLDRYLLFTTPFLYMMIVALLKMIIGDLEKPYLLMIFAIPLMLYCVYIPDNNRNGGEMGEYVNESLQENDQIFLAPAYYDLTFLYHFDQDLFKNYLTERFNETDNFQALYIKDSLKFNENIAHVFFVDGVSEYMYPENGIKDSLLSRFKLIDQREFKGGTIIYKFKNDKIN
jgi:uncharacterized membrane protein